MEYKFAILGKVGVGKSAITLQIINNHFVDEYDSTIEDFYRKQITVDGEPCLVEFVDSARSPDDEERPWGPSDNVLHEYSHGAIIVVSITDEDSIAVAEQWAHKYRQTHKGVPKERVPIMLVANKIDLEPERVLSREICHRFVKEHDALFLEVSAKSQEKIHDIMSEMVRKYRQIDVRAGAERLRERNTAANHGKSKCIII